MSVADSILDWLAEKVMPWFLLIMIAGLFVFIVLAAYLFFVDSKRPNFELKKDDWSCTQVHNYTTTTYVMVGKVMVPQTMTHNDCIQWSHK